MSFANKNPPKGIKIPPVKETSTIPKKEENTTPDKQGEIEEENSTPSEGTTRLELSKDWDEEAVINSILSGDHFEYNKSNNFNNLTYHWRLYCMPDTDFVYEGDESLANIKSFYERIDSFKQVTIAETGVTGYNIGDVEMESVFGDQTSRGASVTEINVKISEPNGVSFLDALRDAAFEAGVQNYVDFFYYLELTFKGYTVDGDIELSPFSDMPNGGRWLWTVRINNIDVNLGSGGGEYRLSMTPIAQQALDEEYGTAIDTMIVRGETVGEFFDNLSTSLTESWNRRLVLPTNSEGYISHQFQIHGISGSGNPVAERTISEEETNKLKKKSKALKDKTSKAANDLDKKIQDNENKIIEDDVAEISSKGITPEQISSMSLRPQDQDWNNIRTHQSFALVDPTSNPAKDGEEAAPADVLDVPTANIGRGTTIAHIIEQIMGQTEQAQNLAKDSHSDRSYADDEKTTINSKGFRECVTWQVVPEVRFNKSGEFKYDFYTNRYGRNIIWHIYPKLDQEPILSHLQISQAFDPEKGQGVQQSTLAALAARGFLPKRYDYLFTGVNTEVLNFDLNFNFTWSVNLPRFQNYYHDQNLTHARVNPLQLLDDIDRNVDEQTQVVLGGVEDIKKKIEDGSISNEDAKQLKDKTAALKELTKRREEVRADALLTRQQAEERAKAIYGEIPPLEQNYDRVFIETVQDQNRQSGNSNKKSRLPLVPFSFAGGDEAKQEAGYGSTGQWHNGRQLYGAILNQQYGPTTTKFQQIEMTVRGDPFWIGSGTIEQTINHHHEASINKTDSAYYFLGQNCFIFRFKYPVNVDDSGSIVLKDNETVTGVYKVTRVKNKFQNGMFTQDMSAVRMPLIDLFSSMFGLKSGEEPEEQEKPENKDIGLKSIDEIINERNPSSNENEDDPQL